MKFLYLPLLLFSLIASEPLSGQQASSRDSLCQVLEWTFDIDLDTIEVCDFFLLDGEVQYFTVEGEDEVVDFGFRSVNYVWITEAMFPHKSCDLLLLVESSLPQSNRKKKALLKGIRRKFNTNPDVLPDSWTCGSCPPVSIDGRFFLGDEARVQLNKIRSRQIDHIIVYNHPMNKAIYGSEGGRNGIVIINTN